MWCGTLKRVVWYFEEGGIWYFEDAGMRLNMEEGGMVLCIGMFGTLKRVVWYFEEGCMVL